MQDDTGSRFIGSPLSMGARASTECILNKLILLITAHVLQTSELTGCFYLTQIMVCMGHDK